MACKSLDEDICILQNEINFARKLNRNFMQININRSVSHVQTIELKRTGTLPEAGNLKPKFWGSGGITRLPCENRAGSFAKYKQNPGRKMQEMS